jgi:hypothetical protein
MRLLKKMFVILQVERCVFRSECDWHIFPLTDMNWSSGAVAKQQVLYSLPRWRRRVTHCHQGWYRLVWEGVIGRTYGVHDRDESTTQCALLMNGDLCLLNAILYDLIKRLLSFCKWANCIEDLQCYTCNESNFAMNKCNESTLCLLCILLILKKHR